jgi:hypothetical protein
MVSTSSPLSLKLEMVEMKIAISYNDMAWNDPRVVVPDDETAAVIWLQALDQDLFMKGFKFTVFPLGQELQQGWQLYRKIIISVHVCASSCIFLLIKAV